MGLTNRRRADRVNPVKSKTQKNIIMVHGHISNPYPCYTNFTSSVKAQVPETQPAGKARKTMPVPKKGFIHDMRKRGFKIRVRHFRVACPAVEVGMSSPVDGVYLVTKENRKTFSHIWSNGGVTELDVTFPDGVTVVGRATCSLSDSYNKRLGTYIAFRRAADTHKVTKNTRQE
jgi:hypothetical protein